MVNSIRSLINSAHILLARGVSLNNVSTTDFSSVNEEMKKNFDKENILNNSNYENTKATSNIQEQPKVQQSFPQTQQIFPQPQQSFPQTQQQIPTPTQFPNPETIQTLAKNYINSKTLHMIDDISEEEGLNKASFKLAQLPVDLFKTTPTNWEPINYRNVKDGYKLYKEAYVEIFFEEKTQKLLYKIIEPELTPDENEALVFLKRAFIHVFEKVSPEKKDVSREDIVVYGVSKLSKRYGYNLDEDSKRKVSYYLIRDFLGLEIIEPIMHDPFVEDISCDGVNIPIFINHLKYGSLQVTRGFREVNVLNSFIIKIAQKTSQEISLSKPILQGSLKDGSRVEAIYGEEISAKGSSFTIRKFRAKPFTPIHLLEKGTIPSFLLAYLWLAVENKQSLLVSGGTATGKTTILNALSLFVPPTAKIVSIEDTPEINLPHEHWLSMVSREREGKSEVTMFDLLKASLRERPEYIIVGEIRGAEASVLFQGMATGHAGLGTVHGDKFSDLVNRMTIAPINLPKPLLTELDIVIFMRQVKVKNNMTRRVSSVIEILDFNQSKDDFKSNEFLKYIPEQDSFEFASESYTISKILDARGGKRKELWKEIEKRRRILEMMLERKILEFEDVGALISSYYKDPLRIFEAIENYEKKE